MSLLRLVGAAKTYAGPSPVIALRDVNLTIDQGEYVAVVGPSGSGKSTLLNVLALLDQPSSGTYTINGEEVGEANDIARAKLRSHWFAFVFQAFHLLESRTVLANVEMGLMYRQVSAEQRRAQAIEAIDFVGLNDRTNMAVNTLSGGQRQRVAIARAIAAGAPVLVADEPTGSLDSVTSAMVMDVFEKLKQERGTTIVLVTHDPNVANRAHRRIQVFDGRVSELGSSYTEMVDDPTDVLPPIRRDANDHLDDDGTRQLATETSNDLTASTTEEQHDLPTDDGRIGNDAAVAFRDIVTDAWASLTDYPKRMIGMVIAVALGVAMSLATLGIGQSASSQVSETFDLARNTQVKAFSPFDVKDQSVIDDITSDTTLDRVRHVAGVTNITALIRYGTVPAKTTLTSKEEEVTILGAPDIRGVGQQYPIEWADQRNQFGEHDVILGKEMAAKLNLGPIALSPSVFINGRPFRVAGLIRPSGLDFEIGSAAILTPKVAKELSQAEHVSFDITTMPGAAQQVAGQLPVALWPRDPDQISVEAPPDPQTMRETIESNITTMLYTLTGVSILAAIVALTNAMTTAVGRRTGEFGLRRAMGARRRHIATLVALESGMLGALGGLTGTVLALLAVLGVTIWQRWQPVFDVKLLPLGLAGGIVVGTLSALAAMFRAAAIEPADALRR
ncbi:ATP-binding cassette domain-containing protein [Stomatohabitans albus]|uniref:ABC transporter ATP-binding protein/permease n=1 Tax=Stomatohabitans albus TaxID=3110766 RepID=UPI00300D4464